MSSPKTSKPPWEFETGSSTVVVESTRVPNRWVRSRAGSKRHEPIVQGG